MHSINEQALIEFVFAHYHQCLLESRRARRFLHDIGFTDPQLMDSLHLGFSDRSLGRQLPRDSTPGGAAARGVLRRLGLFKPSGHELLRGCVVFPLMDQQWRVMGCYSFLLEPYEKSGHLVPVSWVAYQPQRQA